MAEIKYATAESIADARKLIRKINKIGSELESEAKSLGFHVRNGFERRLCDTHATTHFDWSLGDRVLVRTLNISAEIANLEEDRDQNLRSWAIEGDETAIAYGRDCWEQGVIFAYEKANERIRKIFPEYDSTNPASRIDLSILE